MDFDLSSLDKLNDTQTATRTSKFAPTARPRSRRPGRSAITNAQPAEALVGDAKEVAIPASGDRGRSEHLEEGIRAAAVHPTEPGLIGTEVPGPSQAPNAAPVCRTPAGYDLPGPSLQAGPSAEPHGRRASGRKGGQPAEPAELPKGVPGPSTSGPAKRQTRAAKAAAGSAEGLQLAVMPVAVNKESEEAARKGRKGRSRNSRLPPDINVATMSLKDIIKCAYAKERARLEEERRKKEAEEAQEGGASEAAAAAAPAAMPMAAPTAVALAPRVEVVDGQMRIVEQSLSIQAQPEASGRIITVEDNPKLNNLTYAKRMNNDRWSAEDTELFYKALRLFGTDFTLIERMFPGRKRKALKNKLQREYRADFKRVDAALSGGGAASVESYKEVIALLKQHMEDHENTGMADANGGEQQPDLTQALANDPPEEEEEVAEGDERAEEEPLALPPPQDGSQQARGRARTKASQRRKATQQPAESEPACAAAMEAVVAAFETAAAEAPPQEGPAEEGPANKPKRRKVLPRVPAQSRRRVAAS